MSSFEKMIDKVRDIVGPFNVGKISIAGVSVYEMQPIEIKQLVPLLLEIKKRREKKTLTVDAFILKTLKGLLEVEDLSNINIVSITPERMDKAELVELEKLIRIMKLRSKGYKIIEDRFSLDGENIIVTFDYHPFLIQQMQGIETSKYHKTKKHWTVHISQWPAIEDLFRTTQPNIELAYLDWREYHRVSRLRLTNKGCYITGVEIPTEEIHMATSFPDLNARHMESFKNGTWDGRIALFDKGTGFFPYGLLGKVLFVLKQHNITYEYIDERSRPSRSHEFEMNVNLRDYQENTLKIAMEQGRGILQLATGAGKTKTASAIVSTYGMNTIFFVHTKFLLGQAKEALEEVLGCPVGQVGDGIVDIKPVTVAMVQTTIRALGDEYKPSDDDMDGDSEMYQDDTDITDTAGDIVAMLDRSEVVFFDECQFVAAETFYKIANYCNAYYKYGLSATPYRSDKKDMMIEAALGPVIDQINASYLIKRGFLTRPKIHYFKVGHMKGQEERNYQQVYREEIVENYERNQYIVKSTKKLNSKNKSVLILCQQVNHGKLLQAMFEQEGMDVEFVYGMDNLAKRDMEVYKLRTKKKLALIATTIADEGLDVPSLDAVILGGGGKSPSKGMQRVGRAIRVFGQNEEIFEIFSSTKELISRNKNTLIIVESVEKGEAIKEFFASTNPARNKYPLDIDFYHGPEFRKNKEIVFKNFTKKNMQSMIVLADDITEEEVMSYQPIDAILISVGEKFNSNKIEKMPRNVYPRRLQIQTMMVKGKDNVMKEKEEAFADVFVDELMNIVKDDSSKLILVDETKYANAIKDSLKEKGIKITYLTGEKSAEKLPAKIEDLISKKNNLLMVNATYIKEALPYHLVDHIFVVGGIKPAYKALEEVQKDVRIFTKKDEAYVVDFIDNAKWCYNHSLERKNMFATESEFVITGW